MMRLNTGQRLALNLDSHIAVDAGAGTGKTRTIVERVIQHYLSRRQRATEILPVPERPQRISLSRVRNNTDKLTDPTDWKGLLPGEVVLLTFTNLAAEEMKGRLRDRIKKLSTGSLGSTPEADPRLRSEADKEQLMMLLEDAPIGTIDSFFTRLIKPHLASLGELMDAEIVTDAERGALERETIDAFWALPSDPKRFTYLDSELLQTDQSRKILQSRDRLVKTYSGRSRLSKVLRGLMSNSILVEEATRNLSEGESFSPSLLTKAMLSCISFKQLDKAFSELQSESKVAIDTIKNYMHVFTDSTWKEGDRVTLLDALSTETPQSHEEKVHWISRLIALSRKNPFGNVKEFPSNSIPRSEAWPSGILTYTAMGASKEAKSAKKLLKESISKIGEIISSEENIQIMEIARILLHHADVPGLTHIPYPPQNRVTGELKSQSYSLDIQAESMHLQDLSTSMVGLLEISRNLKFRSKLRDFDDVSRLAGDLLLLRCPRICKVSHFYPREVIGILETGPSEPWLDDHIEKALFELKKSIESTEEAHDKQMKEKAFLDLNKRWETLRSIRRRYRAFIIDEAQDNSPLQWRLLARLWGPREVKTGEPQVPETPWQPTICYVGDVKQSIYAFRHAEASRFREYTNHLRSTNRWELENIPLLSNEPPLRSHEMSRDPRRDHDTPFTTAKNLRIASGRDLEPWIRFDQVDSVNETLVEQDILARKEGLIRLDVNFRTKSGLLEEMNTWWREIFSEKHRTIPRGGWYADAQDLRSPSKSDLSYGDVESGDPVLRTINQLDGPGHLEWICPVTDIDLSDPPHDLGTPIDPLANNLSDRVEINARLIAMRVKSLIEGRPIKIKGANGEWKVIESAQVDPGDIMILMATRTGIRDALLRELRQIGVPSHADLEGDLFDQPVTKALEALIQLCARPTSRHHLAWVARSPLIGLSDNQLDELLSSANQDMNMMHELSDYLGETPLGNLVRRWMELAGSDRIIQMLEETLDYSDLLIAHSDDSDRQNAERAVTVIEEILDREEGSILATADTLRSLREDGQGGVRSVTKPPSDTVRLMSIHKSKGLEARVVILADLFSERQVRNSHQSVNRFGVSADIFSGNPKPWGGNHVLRSGVWEYSNWINKSRRDAENRRLLYVAATRAQDSLIIVGSPDGRNASKWVDGQGVSFIHDARDHPPLGHMITNSMRHRDWESSEFNSPWLTQDDRNSTKRPSGRGGIVLDPFSLHGKEGSNKRGNKTRMVLIHSQECLSPTSPHATPYTLMKNAIDSISSSPDRTAPDFDPIPSPPRYIKIAPSSLHSESDPTKSGGIIRESENLAGRLTPTELGNVVHRVVEVGIGNFGTDPNPPLPPSWTTKRPNRLNEETLLRSVLRETGVGPLSDSVIGTISRIIGKIDEGHLGRLTSGKVVSGHTLQGLRTELPFMLSKSVEFEPITHGLWTPDGMMPTSVENKGVVQMEGLIDIVVCTEDADGRPTIRAIDIKTDSTIGGRLEEGSYDHHDPITEFERELLHRHGMQLALYHKALESMNEQLPEEMRRLVLPPAIVWAGNGRMVEYPDDLLRDLNSKLESTLSEIARKHLLSSA